MHSLRVAQMRQGDMLCDLWDAVAGIPHPIRLDAPCRDARCGGKMSPRPDALP